MADQTPEPVQPEEGQGGGGQADAPYAEYLQRIPEEVRGDIEPIFQEWDANVTRRFQDAAEYRKNWEPYEQIGLNQTSPQEVQELLQFRDALAQPEVIQQWYEQYAQANGLTPQQAAEQAQQPGVEDFFVPDKEQIDRLMAERLSPLEQELAQLREFRDQQEYQARYVEAERYVEGEIERLQSEHSDFNREIVEMFVAQYTESDPEHAVQRAYEDSVRFISQIQTETLQQKAGQPAPAESGGTADTSVQEPRTLKDAGAQALEMLRAANAA